MAGWQCLLWIWTDISVFGYAVMVTDILRYICNET